MTLQLLFWMLMIISFIFGLWSSWPINGQSGKSFGSTFLIFVLIAILGWKVFGPAIHG